MCSRLSSTLNRPKTLMKTETSVNGFEKVERFENASFLARAGENAGFENGDEKASSYTVASISVFRRFSVDDRRKLKK